MRDGEVYAGGLTLNFFPSATFEPENADNIENNRAKARNLLRVLMMGWTENWKNLLSRETVNAVFVERDHTLTKSMRHAFQEGFHHVFTQLENQTLSDLQKNQANLFISNCLAYLPYFDPSAYESIAVPQYVDGRWQMIDYKVVPIELTPTWGFKKLFLSDYDRVFAYGLEPITNSNAEPHLLFMGTTYPAGQGFFTTINTDLEAFETAGKKLYRTGRANIARWLDQQSKKAHVCGTSLGGALSLLLALDQGDKLSRVDALNPPLLYHPWRKSRFDHWDEFTEKPDVYVQSNQDDPISIFGVSKTDWNFLRVTAPPEKAGTNPVAAHALNYAGLEGTQFIGVDGETENAKRRFRNWWLYSVLRSVVYYTAMIPLRYVVVPTVRFVLSHKIQLLITVPLIFLFNGLPPLFFVVSFPLLLQSLLPAVVIGYLFATLIHYAMDRYSNKRESSLSQFLDFLAKHPLLQFTTGLLTATITTTFILSGFLFPTLIPPLALAFAALPLVVVTLATVFQQIQILFGFNQITLPAYQDPTLARNEELNIYENAVEMTLSYEQILTYYQANRTLKEKPLLPANSLTDEGTPKLFKGTPFTKREVLEKGLDPNTCHETLTFFATKAKANHMDATLRLMEKGKNADLPQRLEDYAIGKLPRDEEEPDTILIQP